MPDTTVWSSNCRLISECLRRNTVTTPSRLNFGSSGVASHVRDGQRDIRAVDGDDIGEHPAAERTLVHETQRGAVVEQHRNPQMVIPRQRPEQHLPAHTEMDDQRRAVIERQPQVFPASTRADDPRIEQPRRQIGGSGLVTAHRAQMVYPDSADGLVDDVCVQPPTNDFDFGKLRHLRQETR